MKFCNDPGQTLILIARRSRSRAGATIGGNFATLSATLPIVAVSFSSRSVFERATVAVAVAVGVSFPRAAMAELFVSYPPREHTTSSSQIFIIGTSEDGAPIAIDGELVDRNAGGHFAPIIPLELGLNTVLVQQGDRQIELQITRIDPRPTYSNTSFTAETIEPNVAIERQLGEPICFSAIAPTGLQDARVAIGDRSLPLTPEPTPIKLPPNLAVLTDSQEELTAARASLQRWSSCAAFDRPGNLGAPEFRATLNGRAIAQVGSSITIAPTTPVEIATVSVPQAIARTGPNTNHSRLTPLPEGTRATITGRDGEWLRLDYGGWIKASEAAIVTHGQPNRAVMRSAAAADAGDWLEFRVPLQTPVPVSVDQSATTLRMQLHQTTAETDIIRFPEEPWVRGSQWQQLDPDRVEFRFEFSPASTATGGHGQQWGYRLRYDDTTLVLSIRKPPEIAPDRPLAGTTILLDPGHGGPEDFGTRGPTGLPEKDMTMTIAQQIRDRLEARGARVVMTREDDIDLWPYERAAMIDAVDPTIALSLHYNALPDNGDPIGTRGISTFWYHPQAEDLSRFLQERLVTRLNRDNYGAIWSNFALTRPSNTLAVLLEFGFAINPDEYDWIVDPTAQAALSDELVLALEDWLRDRATP